MKRWMVAVLSLLLVMVWPGIAFANEDTVTWGKPQTYIYSNLHPYTLNWTGDPLDQGGLSLTKLEIASPPEADIVINQYGSMGAGGILTLSGEKLEDETPRKTSGFQSSVSIEEGKVYLVKLHDGRLAKIRIDGITGGLFLTRVTISFVLEEDKPQLAPSTGGGTPPSAGSGSSADTGQQKPADAGTPASSAPSDAQNNPPYTDNWTENYEVPSENQGQRLTRPDAFSIILRLKSYTATVEFRQEAKISRLPVAPFLSREGRTMVPLRFVSETLGADVKWNPADEGIEIVKEGTRILLWVGSQRAIVNGAAYTLDAPPVKENGTTVVPLRFVSEHLKMHVYYKHGLILISDKENESFETAAEELQGPAGVQVPEYYYGKWNLWIKGTYAPVNTQYYGDGSRDIQYGYTPGAEADWVEIHPDGTYTWRYLGKDIVGYWGIADNGQIKLYDGPMEILGAPWNMKYEDARTALIYAWGIEYEATKAGK